MDRQLHKGTNTGKSNYLSTGCLSSHCQARLLWIWPTSNVLLGISGYLPAQTILTKISKEFSYVLLSYKVLFWKLNMTWLPQKWNYIPTTFLWIKVHFMPFIYLPFLSLLCGLTKAYLNPIKTPFIIIILLLNLLLL